MQLVLVYVSLIIVIELAQLRILCRLLNSFIMCVLCICRVGVCFRFVCMSLGSLFVVLVVSWL